MCNIALVTFS